MFDVGSPVTAHQAQQGFETLTKTFCCCLSDTGLFAMLQLASGHFDVLGLSVSSCLMQGNLQEHSLLSSACILFL